MARVSIRQLGLHFLGYAFEFENQVRKQLKHVGMKVRDTAVRKFGSYQPAVGPYPAWKTLHPWTIREKLRAGSQGHDPLIGHYPPGKRNNVWPAHLRNTIEFDVSKTKLEVDIGTRDPLGLIHEYGAPEANIPPRPFLRPAAFECMDFFHERMEIAAQNAIRGELHD